ncbi:hypothetical protein [Ferrimonas marina]|nr:hypothetical protein [Ferrimonas marina]
MIAPFVFCTEAFIAFAISALLGVPSTIWLLNQCIYARHEVMLKEWCLMVPGALMSFCFVAMGLNFVGHHALRVLS